MTEQIEKTKQELLKKRPPVVVVLGHVDHGKSSLIEKIKEIKILEKESGGITQHIGAYQIEHSTSSGNVEKITFIDTPGHAVFSAMRSRGAKVADIAVLVVAGEEGVKPQTKEAIIYIKKAGIPMIVAINKMDKPESNPEKVKRELIKEEVLVESMGGKIPSIEISAKTGKGIQELLNMILLVAEMENLEADFSCPGEGVIVESYLDVHRGPTATIIIGKGTFKLGQLIATCSASGKIKSLEDSYGNVLKEALPSIPCVMLGFQKVPKVGEKIQVFKDISSVQEHIQVGEKRYQEREVIDAGSGKKILNLILKADVLGSVEAIEQVIKNIPQEEVFLRILKKDTGNITEFDVKLACSSKAKIIGFRVNADKIASKLALRDNISILKFDVIYDLSQAIRNLMEKMIEPEIKRKDLAQVEVLAVFHTDKNRQIIGGKVIDGEVVLGSKIEIFRNEELVGQGKLVNLQKNKKDIGSAKKGEECGMLYEGDIRVEDGDIVHIFKEEKEKRGL